MHDHKQSIKELVRHTMFLCGLSSAVDFLRRLRGRNTAHMTTQDMAGTFSQIYQNDIWIETQAQDSKSGVGSATEATAQLATKLSVFLREVNCRKLIDVGCGDFNWMKHVTGDFEYVGIDIVPTVIERNISIYGDRAREFVCMDASRSSIPHGDVAICREVIFHLCFDAAKQLLRNIANAGFKYVLITSDSSIWFNSDIRNGDFRRLNLLRDPFRFSQPIYTLVDDRVSKGRFLGVWQGTDIPL